jgi:hypothetical protein
MDCLGEVAPPTFVMHVLGDQAALGQIVAELNCYAYGKKFRRQFSSEDGHQKYMRSEHAWPEPFRSGSKKQWRRWARWNRPN